MGSRRFVRLTPLSNKVRLKMTRIEEIKADSVQYLRTDRRDTVRL